MYIYGIRSQTNSWIGSFLGGRTQLVIVDGVFSSHSTVNLGVPQGSVLGPLLFLLYINDLPNRVRFPVRLFADDCILYRQMKSDADSLQLQRDLDIPAIQERDWRMSLNIKNMPHHAHTKVTQSPTLARYTSPVEISNLFQV